MKTRDWKQIIRKASVDAFLLWILEQPDSADWSREDACGCPLHDFIEDVTGESLNANSPELAEHWSERPTQSWPTPWWMTWIIRSVDHSGEGPITKTELLSLALIMVEQDFEYPINSPEEWLEVA